MKTLFLFRHGETDWNVAERFQGHIDVPLNQTGRTQAEKMIPYFKINRIDAILSSDLSRARETAQIVATGLEIPVFHDPGLREAYLGEAQGLTQAEIQEKFGIHISHRWHSPVLSDADVCYPGGETGYQVGQRAFETLRRFLEFNSLNSLGVATHGGVIRRIMQRLRPVDLPPLPIPNGAVFKIHFDPSENQFLSILI